MADLSKKQMEELRRMMLVAEEGGLLSGDLEESDPAEWMRDLHVKRDAFSPKASSMWDQGVKVPAVTQTEAENVAGALRGGLDGGTKTPWNILGGGDVTVSRAPSMGRDQVWWDMKRPLVFGMDAWLGGADLANLEGGRYSADNPYVYTDEMRAADEAVAAEIDASMWYDPVADVTHRYGMTMKGDHTQGMTEADYSADDWQWLQEGQYYEGHKQITPEAVQRMRELGYDSRGGLLNVFHQDVTPLLDALRSDDWNPFYEQDRQNIIDRQREIGVLGDKLTAYEKRRDNNVMDYLYRNFSEGTSAGTRRGVAQAWNKYLQDNDKTHRDFYGRRMTERLFNEIGLDKYGEYNAEFSPSDIGANPLAGMMGGGSGSYNSDIVSARNAALAGPASAAYAAEKERQASRPSIASLFEEMKNFRKEEDPAEVDTSGSFMGGNNNGNFR